MTPPDRAPEPLSDIVWELRNAAIDYGYASEPTEAERARLDRAHAAVLDAARDSRPVGEGLDVERLARARFTLIDDIGTELSRELAQGNPFEPCDRLYVTKTITRVLDAARDRATLAAGPVAAYAALSTDQPASTEAGEDG